MKLRFWGKLKLELLSFQIIGHLSGVIDAVEKAFEKGSYDSLKNCKIHIMKSGMKIQVNLNEASEVVSAFPLYD